MKMDPPPSPSPSPSPLPSPSPSLEPAQAIDLGTDGLGASDVHVAHVRFAPGDDHLLLRLRIFHDHKTFCRAADERLDKLRYRLQLLAAQAAAGADEPYLGNRTRKARNKWGGHSPVATVAVRFFTRDGDEITGKNALLGDALTRTTRLVIGADSYVVLHNQPTVVRLTVPSPMLAGIPIVPIAETEFCSADACAWRWLRIGGDTGDVVVSESRRFTPTEDDLGCCFRVECHAPSLHSRFARDSTASCVTTPVVKGPDRRVFLARQRLGATPATADGFRVMSYNVLFDGYTSTAQAKAAMFPYAQQDALHEMYRMQLVFREMEEAHADIICLQEMGQTTFRDFFVPMMAPLGFHAFYSGKTGSTHEGCAVLVRSERFDVVDERLLDLSIAVRYSTDASVVALLHEFPEIAKGFRKIPSVAQFVTLRHRRENRVVLLVNTHLYFREDADMIRLLQAVAIVREVERVRAALSEPAAVVLCGDLNAFPDTATTAFLLDGVVDDRHRHWQEAPSFVWNRQAAKPHAHTMDQSGPPPSPPPKPGRVQHSLELTSACGIPEFTNFAGTFVGTLDYILVTAPQLAVDQVFPLFSREDVSREVALPSSVFPSDHVSLIADVHWRRTQVDDRSDVPT
ncbi:hypothetical protein P43SY_005538 [Pythium insidiosum]|uniref:Endonuclease/exonuclease/phosphatase domain-containing protein n=1 Tax=Pythium insidiosum TaxID=114742 RepID=A0AAD5M671_PYTIN|nr:hypothetical protein P43SY_005538 [Pythium insidiosum]